jgi:hypothetical protein
MAITVSPRDLTPANIADQRTTLMRDLQAMLAPVAGSQPIVCRDVRPTDFNNGTLVGQLSNPALTANTYNTDIYSSWTKLLPTQVLGLIGFCNLSGTPRIDELEFHASGQVLGIQVVDLAYSNTIDSRVFFFPPITWVYNEHVQIDMLSYAGATLSQCPFEWLGIIAETQSQVVPPRQIGAGGKIPGMI